MLAKLVLSLIFKDKKVPCKLTVYKGRNFSVVPPNFPANTGSFDVTCLKTAYPTYEFSGRQLGREDDNLSLLKNAFSR